MGNLFTKCCKESETDSEKSFGELEVNGTKSNGMQNGFKNPICEKDAEKVMVDDAAAVVDIDVTGHNSSTQPLIDIPDCVHEENDAAAAVDECLDPKHYYKMDHKKRGMALIFNHEIFNCNSPRKGTNVDRDRLEHTLESLGFDVKIFENETYSDIKGILEEIAAMDHSDSDCLMIVVLSHGDIVPLVDRRNKKFTTILSHDLVSYLHAADNKYPLQMVWENFTDKRCPSLKSKPRIFLIQACQGEDSDTGFGVPVESSRRRNPRSDVIPFSTTKYKHFDSVIIHRDKILPQKDFIVVYSTMPGYYSYRDIITGTWFIESLCKVLNEKKHELDLNQILTMVNRTIAIDYQTDGVGLKQMPCVVSMLTKLLLFPKKTHVTNGF